MKNFKLYILFFLVGLFACEQEEFPGSGLESLRDFTLDPIPGASIQLNSIKPDEDVVITWAQARSGFDSPVIYTVMLDEVDGDFSSPVVELPADDDGLATQISLTNAEFEALLDELGVEDLGSATYQWTVKATNGDITKVAEPATVTLNRFQDALAPFNLLTPSSGTNLELNVDAPESTIVVDWEDSFSGLGNSVTYTWEAVDAAGSFDDPALSYLSDENGYSSQITFTHQQLDDALANLGLEQAETANLKWRVVATSGDLISTSEAAEIELMRFDPFVGIRSLYLVGSVNDDAGNWDPNLGVPLFRDPDNNFKFYYSGRFRAGAFKLLEQRGNWDSQWGKGADGELLSFPNNPQDIPVPTDGYYEFVFDAVNMTYSLTPIDEAGANDYTTIGVIGYATTGNDSGWNADVNMIQSVFDPHIWFINDFTLFNGEIKFRAEDSWDTNWGNNTFPVGQGTPGGPNIPVDAGTYNIRFNDLDGRYILIKQ